MISKTIWVVYLAFSNPSECLDFLISNPEFIAAECIKKEVPPIRPVLRPERKSK